MQQTTGAAGAPPGPRWGSLQRSPRPPSWWGGAGCPLPRTPPPLSAFQASGFGSLGLASRRPKFSNPLQSKILHTALATYGRQRQYYDVSAFLSRSDWAQQVSTALHTTLNTALASRLHCAHCVLTAINWIAFRPNDAFTTLKQRSARLNCALIALLVWLSHAVITSVSNSRTCKDSPDYVISLSARI